MDLTRAVLLAAAVLTLLFETPAVAQIKLGVAGPMTGPEAAYGLQMKAGVELAVAELNKRGGLLGQQVEIIIDDDASDPIQGVEAARRLVAAGVRLVVGHYKSNVSIPASEVYAAGGALMIAPSGTDTRLTERGLWNVARMASRDDRQREPALAWLLTEGAEKRIAIVWDGTQFGKGHANAIRAGLKRAGRSPVLEAEVKPGETEFSALIARLRASKADLVYWGGLTIQGGQLALQMKQSALPAFMFGISLLGPIDNFARYAGYGAEGTLFTTLKDPSRRPEAQAALAALRSQAPGTGGRSDSLRAHAAVEVIAQAAERAKTFDAKAVSAAIRSGGRFRTVLGEVLFDSKGDITGNDFAVHVWRRVNQQMVIREFEPGVGLSAVFHPTSAVPPSESAKLAKPAIAAAPKPPAETRIALIIGNGAYGSQSPLPNPRRDAELLGETLRRIGFVKVVVAHDLGHAALRRALLDFSEEAERADWALIYFAGHGIEIERTNYMIPVDARLKSDRAARFEAVPLDDALASVAGARKMRIVILDACRDNPFAKQMVRAGATRTVTRGLGRPPEPARATLVAYAARDGEVAEDGTGANSPFVAALTKRLSASGTEISKLFRLVRDDVQAATNGRQEPYVYGSLPGEDFFFNPQ